LLGPERGDAGQRADDRLELRDHVEQQPAVDRQRLREPQPPAAKLVHPGAEDPPGQAAERLGEALVGGPAAELAELAADERARAITQALLELGDQRRLADPRAARDQHHRRLASLRASPGPLEHLEVALASEQPLGYPQLRPAIAGAELEGRQLAVPLQRV